MEAQQSSQSEGGGILGLLAAIFSVVKSGLSSTWEAATRDGTLAAAGRQGADELGMALKAFPESIQVDEPGTIWNPTQGEIAAARNDNLPSPSAIARGGKSADGQEGGNAKDATSPTPSQVAKASAADLYGPDQAKDETLPSPSEIASGKGDVFMAEKSWQERELDRQKAREDGAGENDQNERAKGRVLPDEEKELEKERERLGPSRCR